MKQKYETVQLVAHIEPRKWYTIMLGYGGSASRPFAAVEKTGDKHRGNSMSLFGPNAMKYHAVCDVWRMIDENGEEMTADDNDLQANGSIGIGSLVPAPNLPDLTDERLAELVETGKRNAERERIEAEEAARKHEDEKRRLAREYSWLPNKCADGHLRVAKVAQNLRTELKRKFPGVKFSVTSSSFSGGNSITVHYEDGPAFDDVEGIVNRYQDSHADAESGDYWDYDPSAFNEVFGGAKFTHLERDMSAATESVLFAGIGNEARADYEKRTRIRRIFTDTPLPVGAVVTGIEGDKITFDAPTTAATAATASRTTAAGTDGKARVAENPEKNGVEIYFPSIPSEEVRAQLKANGWRWSRFAKCWYNKASDETRAFALEIYNKVAS